jgi:hypothetical protein
LLTEGQLGITDFEIGKDDGPITYRISQKLIGRLEETKELFEAFNQVKQTKCNCLVLVRGYLGSGKSTLVQQLKAVRNNKC